MGAVEILETPQIELCRSVQKYRRKIVRDQEKVKKAVEVWRTLGDKIVMTIGTWDLFHIGHARYIISALEHGDRLVVGVDSDRGVKLYKDPGRPAVPENERMEVLCYLPVDIVTIIDDINEEGKWQYGLLHLVQPDVFVTVKGSYSDEQLKEIGKNAKEVLILPRQAETSTSNMVRDLLKSNLPAMIKKLQELI